MKPESDIENSLEKLGNDWPRNRSIVSNVSERLDLQPQLVRPARSNWFSLKSFAAVAASVLLLAWILYPAQLVVCSDTEWIPAS